MKSFESELNNKEEVMEDNFSKNAFLKEKSVFEKLSGKAKEIAGVLMFISSLSFAPGIVKETFAGQKKGDFKASEIEIEKEKTQEEKAIDFFDKIRNLKDHPEILSEAHNKVLKSEEARVLIYLFAASRKGITLGRISPKDIYDALQELNGVSGIYADRFLGNNDGNIDIEEIEKLNKEIGSSVGISTFMQMIKEFSYIKGVK